MRTHVLQWWFDIPQVNLNRLESGEIGVPVNFEGEGDSSKW